MLSHHPWATNLQSRCHHPTVRWESVLSTSVVSLQLPRHLDARVLELTI